MSYGTVQAEKMTTESGYSLGAGNASSFKNRLINGGMVIDQRNGGAAVTANAGTAFTCDRWKAYLNSGGAMTFQQSSVVPNNTFKNSVLVTVTSTGTPSEAAITQTIEGYNIADLGFGTSDAKSLVASFWIRSSVTGTYCFSLRQGSGARSFVSNFSIASANTWQQVVVPIPGDTTGTYNSTTGAGFIFEVCFGASTLVTSTTDAWQGGNFVCTSSQVNLAATNGATLYITGCQLEVGTVVTSFDFRSIGQELFLCQRYFFQLSSTNAGNGQNAGITGHSNGSNELQRTNMSLPVTMRTVPTISVSNVKGTGTDLRAYNGAAVQNVTALGQQFSTINYLQADWTLAGTFSPTGQYLSVLWQDNVNGGWIRANAEI